ncbi:transketolase, partial [Enteropsectra breve]
MDKEDNSNEGICIRNLRTIAADMVQKANSGHPGAPLGLAHFMHILFTEFLVLDPSDPRSPSRDIFLLSNGHACAIQYIMNYLVGYLDLQDLKEFRQLHSKTPGHPEKNTHGIEISTGPLGQGVAASVGFATSIQILKSLNNESEISYSNANKDLNKNLNKNDSKNDSSMVYCVFGDGCYQEGIAQEAFSLCARLSLNNITFIYDYNGITIDGPTELSMNEDVELRFKSLGFSVHVADGSKSEEIRAALEYRATVPKVIILHTTIGKDTAVANSCAAHGSPLGCENIKKLREKYNFPDIDFYISEELKEAYKRARERMSVSIKSRASSLQNDINASNNHVWYKNSYESKCLSTRKHLYNALNNIQTNCKIITGCADLTPSVLSRIEGSKELYKELNSSKTNGMDDSKYFIRFGIREHCMCAVMNGMAAHGSFIPIAGTFLNFISYGFPAVRLGAMDRLKNIYILTHDSVQLGEDGPTHQPIETLATLRATAGLVVMRPCDGRETWGCLRAALEGEGPVALVLSRQDVEEVSGTSVNMSFINTKSCNIKDSNIKDYDKDGNIKGGDNKGGDINDGNINDGNIKDVNNNKDGDIRNGAYFVKRNKNHRAILLATGAEVGLACRVADAMENTVSVVSFVSWELFEKQNEKYKNEILESGVVKISIEALSTFGWSRYSDYQIGIDEYGRSGPGEEVYAYFGFTVEAIQARIERIIK